MAEYVITPREKELPEGAHLMNELHRRGFPVEINLKGTSQVWETIRFYEPGPPEIECFLSRGDNDGRLSVSLSSGSTPEASELQLNLVDLLLAELGGEAESTATQERFTPFTFPAKLKSPHGSPGRAKEIFWVGFSWAVVAAGILLYYFSPYTRPVSAMAAFLSLASAAGLTYSHFKA